jgi:predicted O-methyltransferase YrrM
MTELVENEFLVKYASNAIGGIIEIGSSFGVSSIALGRVAKELDLPMVCVDNWPNRDDYPTWKRNITEARLLYNILPIHMDSEVASKCWLNMGMPLYFDFLFIDADHSYGGVKADWDNWTKLLSKPAYVVLHDIALPGFGVMQFWQELCREYRHEAQGNIGVIFYDR